jgi:hypothetical protein
MWVWCLLGRIAEHVEAFEEDWLVMTLWQTWYKKQFQGY